MIIDEEMSLPCILPRILLWILLVDIVEESVVDIFEESVVDIVEDIAVESAENTNSTPFIIFSLKLILFI
jgi:hypothetical protein